MPKNNPINERLAFRVDIHNLDSIAESTAAPSHCEGPTAQLAYDLTACSLAWSGVGWKTAPHKDAYEDKDFKESWARTNEV